MLCIKLIYMIKFIKYIFPKTEKKVCAKIVQFKGARNLKGELIYVFDGCAKI